MADLDRTGRPQILPKRAQVCLRLDPELTALVDAYAARFGITRANAADRIFRFAAHAHQAELMTEREHLLFDYAGFYLVVRADSPARAETLQAMIDLWSAHLGACDARNER
jgi:hypothetical protein